MEDEVTCHSLTCIIAVPACNGWLQQLLLHGHAQHLRMDNTCMNGVTRYEGRGTWLAEGLPGATASKQHNIGWGAALGHTLPIDWMILDTHIEQVSECSCQFYQLRDCASQSMQCIMQIDCLLKTALCYGTMVRMYPRLCQRRLRHCWS